MNPRVPTPVSPLPPLFPSFPRFLRPRVSPVRLARPPEKNGPLCHSPLIFQPAIRLGCGTGRAPCYNNRNLVQARIAPKAIDYPEIGMHYFLCLRLCASKCFLYKIIQILCVYMLLYMSFLNKFEK